MPLILGSQSPRREEILGFFSIPFIKASSNFDEESIPFLGDPRQYVQTLALKKGEALVSAYPKDPILTADTVVFLNGQVYNKPKNKEEAFLFLQDLQGKEHSVFTAVCLHNQGHFFIETEETKILFYELSSEEIFAYLAHINFLDKAGGYAIQQGGAILVKKIEGCYYNVMGLPIGALKIVLKKARINLWEHLKLL